MLRLMLMAGAAAFALGACGEPAPEDDAAPDQDAPAEAAEDQAEDAGDMAGEEGEAELAEADADNGDDAEDDGEWPPAARAGSDDITEADLDYLIETLADDRFEGRAPASENGEPAAQWIADQLEASGVQPGGADGSWFQAVPLIEATLDEQASSLDISVDGEPMGLEFGSDTVFWTQNPEEEVSIEDTEMVFVGYGVNAPEYGWNDYEGVDVEGKTVVILVNDPGFVNPDGELFNGSAMTYYGRWTYKYEEAARQGAAGAIIVHQTDPASYGWDVVRSSWTGPQFTLDREGELELVPVQGWIQLEVAEDLFEAVGEDFNELYEAAGEEGFEPVALEGATMSAELFTDLDRLESDNVVGMIEGTERPDEYVVLMAHWDHIGVRQDFSSDDNIYNGAVDNATGTAMIMELAERFATAEEGPERSVIVLSVTAEESGLLGSLWYAENPIYPLDQTVAGFNFDAILPVGRTEDVVVVGYGSSELEDILAEEAEGQGRTITPEATPEGGFYYRSDHLNFARKGVPMLYAKDGTTHVERGADYVEQLNTAYRVNDYHAPSDEYDSDWDLSGLLENTQLAYDVARRLTDSEDWPNWYEGNEFRAIRDEMMESAD